MGGRRWTNKEIQILKSKYPDHGSDIPELDRTNQAIRWKASKIGLFMGWTNEEVQLLKDKYPSQGSDIPGLSRSKQAIRAKAQKVGVRKDRKGHIQMNDQLHEYLHGLLLGDGCITSSKGGTAFYRHTDSYREYIVWLKKRLESMGLPCGKVYKRRRKNFLYFFYSRSAEELEKLYYKWYPNGDKRIPENLEITPIILKNWFIGDGTYCKRHNTFQLRIACLFDEKGKQRIVDQINEKTPMETHNNKQKIYFTTDSHQIFFDYVLQDDNEIPPGYGYKFPEEVKKGVIND